MFLSRETIHYLFNNHEPRWDQSKQIVSIMNPFVIHFITLGSGNAFPMAAKSECLSIQYFRCVIFSEDVFA